MWQHPSILAYTSKGQAYSMTLLPYCSPSCSALPSQLSLQLCTPSTLQGIPCRVAQGIWFTGTPHPNTRTPYRS